MKTATLGGSIRLNLCKLASTDRAVSLSAFDTDLLLVAAPNQWIDLSSGTAHDPNPSVLVSKVIATDYCAKSTCPNFERFLQGIFENDQDLIAYVQRAIGYSLTGSTKEQCLFILIGDGANGKSTFVNVINKLLGDYSKSAASQTLIAKGSSSIGDDLVDLVGADLPPEAPSFITRVCRFGFHILLRQFEQARRVRSPQISQALGALQRVFGCPEMSAV